MNSSRQRPGPDRRPQPTPTQHAEVLALVASGMHDPDVAQRVGVTAAAVRGIRRRAGVAGHARPNARSLWRETVAAAHAEGLTTREIAERTGYSHRTCQEYLARLGLKAHR